MNRLSKELVKIAKTIEAEEVSNSEKQEKIYDLIFEFGKKLENALIKSGINVVMWAGTGHNNYNMAFTDTYYYNGKDCSFLNCRFKVDDSLENFESIVFKDAGMVKPPYFKLPGMPISKFAEKMDELVNQVASAISNKLEKPALKDIDDQPWDADLDDDE